MLATLAQDVPRGPGWLFEVKWDGYRAIAYIVQGETRLVSRNGKDLTERFPTVAKQIAKATKSPRMRPRRRGVRARRAGAAELLGDAAGQAGHAARLRGVRRARGRGRAARRPAARRAPRAGSRRCSTGAAGSSSSPASSRTVRRCSRRPRQQGLEGIIAKRADARYRPGQAHSRVAEDQDPRPSGVRDRGLHEGPGPPPRPLRRARARRPGRATSSSTRATSAPGSPTRRSTSCSRSSARSRRRSRRFARSRRCRRCARPTSSG